MKSCRFLLLLVSVLVAESAGAQMKKKFMGIGASYGFTNYQGDLDDNFTFRFVEYGVGLHVQRSLHDRFQLRATLYHGYMEAADSNAKYTTNYKRNLSFRSNIDEISLQVLFRILKAEKGFQLRQRLCPYAFLGISYFHYKPQAATADGAWHDLEPLGTEGQHLEGAYPEPYSLWQFSIPFGGGVYLKLGPSFDLSMEIGLRKTFTDYLDDVSTNYPDLTVLREEMGETAYELSYRGNKIGVVDSDISHKHRGNSGSDDWYAYSNIGVTYYFGIGGGGKGTRGFFRDGP